MSLHSPESYYCFCFSVRESQTLGQVSEQVYYGSWISTSMFITWIHLANRFPVDGLASKHIHGRCKGEWAWCGTGRRPKSDKGPTPPLIQELLQERVWEVESMRNSKVTS